MVRIDSSFIFSALVEASLKHRMFHVKHMISYIITNYLAVIHRVSNLFMIGLFVGVSNEEVKTITYVSRETISLTITIFL